MSDVIVTDEFRDWYNGLSDIQTACVVRMVTRLEVMGLRLGFPHSSAIRGTGVAMRELRTQCSGRFLRVFYIFDEERQAVLLIGGDKTGNENFYLEMVPQAETIWAQYRQERAATKPKE
jgi:hypothetical protein